MPKFTPPGTGWLPDLPDARDYTFHHPKVEPLLRRLVPSAENDLPSEVDLTGDADGVYFTEVENQGRLNSSAAFAVLSLVEYFERRVHGLTFDGSKRFLYKVARNWMSKNALASGDFGAHLRVTLNVLVKFGVPSEEFWPYDIASFDEEPSAFLYGLARPYTRLRYFRLDEANASTESTWEIVKSMLAAGFPVVFGFTIPSSITASVNVPFRIDLDQCRGGQAVVALGYRTDHFGRDRHALLIRNSWGSEWGSNGNGWLPVDYIHKQLARDFWSVISEDWQPCSELHRPSILAANAPTNARGMD